MRVKIDPVMEAMAKKLFGVERACVPLDEKGKMIRRAIKAGAEALRNTPIAAAEKRVVEAAKKARIGLTPDYLFPLWDAVDELTKLEKQEGA